MLYHVLSFSFFCFILYNRAQRVLALHTTAWHSVVTPGLPVTCVRLYASRLQATLYYNLRTH